jgi:hypothetical protein
MRLFVGLGLHHYPCTPTVFTDTTLNSNIEAVLLQILVFALKLKSVANHVESTRIVVNSPDADNRKVSHYVSGASSDRANFAGSSVVQLLIRP